MSGQEANLHNIRGRITHFVNARQKAYEISVRKGRTVPGYAAKISAILMLKVHLQASERWDLQANLRWIHQMRQQILVLLPSEFNEDPRQRKYRQHMLDLLSYCELLLDSKPMFQQKPPGSMRTKELWMRPNTRVLANGKPGVIVNTHADKAAGVDQVKFIDVRLDQDKTVHTFNPDLIQLDRINRFPESLSSQPAPAAINHGSYNFSNPIGKGGNS